VKQKKKKRSANHYSLNGSFAAPNGVVFEFAPDAVGDGLFAAFRGISSTGRYNLGEVPLRHAPPAADFQAYARPAPRVPGERGVVSVLRLQ
jgi:hypothetical protein